MRKFHPILLLWITFCLSACLLEKKRLFTATAVLTEGSDHKACVMIPKNEGFPDTKFYIPVLSVSTERGVLFKKNLTIHLDQENLTMTNIL